MSHIKTFPLSSINGEPEQSVVKGKENVRSANPRYRCGVMSSTLPFWERKIKASKIYAGA
ncbi:hypothetical protein ASPWEDRAFT_43666 [Aspergillus wentii DTO 134E9]|uniref:Uncharacterized protein n=1 Tax=Aspergillus wentii DTO 134E9 TaxID=1073089 RepID=A0A1L9R9W0_ASPWE|nr:uncharacterized protein ASPWEDRAFT_44754 [Aspergillus wentii DTO 134E9]XP_040685388.1 uncharacterized protein ASPWEDRAFT_43666 [Aspergillus wentii DTO 134E9]OJJ30770.1 hypothetical protein ASPWEDRAFT_44754 [Aspergillus wentii DTO 134E9]OJJ31711.1 hypothetical protein ASPWEDRAFT_43666 [Aspergillus wentii DTO 134E9]